MEQEEIYIVSQKRPDGSWNKLVKSQEHWWYSEDEAKEWLDKQDDIIKVTCAIFKVTVTLTEIEKVYDLKLADPAEWEQRKQHLWNSHKTSVS